MNDARNRTRRRSGPRLARWLHTYVSLFGFAALVFFAVTGITLNHAEWFEATSVDREWEGSVPVEWVGTAGPPDRLAVVEWLRGAQGARGAVRAFETTPRELAVTLKGPAYAFDAIVDRESGAVELFESSRGWVAVLNDLHKGRHTGAAWSWLIDVSSVVLALCGLTGIWLLCYLRKLRVRGFLVTALGGSVLLIVWLLGVR